MQQDLTVDEYIFSLIQKNEISEQKELQHLLKEQNCNVPQATLSRRLKKLNIAKVAGIYRAIGYNRTSLPLIMNVKVSDFGMIVLHTNPGDANSLGYYFDQKYVNMKKISEKDDLNILGTIAGDDTLMLILKNLDSTKKVIEEIKKDFPYVGDI